MIITNTKSGNREFLKGTAWTGLAAVAAGCQFERMGFGTGAPMAGFVGDIAKMDFKDVSGAEPQQTIGQTKEG